MFTATGLIILLLQVFYVEGKRSFEDPSWDWRLLFVLSAVVVNAADVLELRAAALLFDVDLVLADLADDIHVHYRLCPCPREGTIVLSESSKRTYKKVTGILRNWQTVETPVLPQVPLVVVSYVTSSSTKTFSTPEVVINKSGIFEEIQKFETFTSYVLRFTCLEIQSRTT